MLPDALTNFEIKEYYLRNNLPKIKDGAYVINLDDIHRNQ